MENPTTGNMGKACGCPHHKIIPLLVVLFGLDFFLGTVGVLTPGFVGVSWPILVGLAGLMMLTKGKCKCCNS